MLTAVLFDLDGTLVNSDPLHFAVWQEMLAQYNLNVDRSFYQQHISGRTNQGIIRDILPQLTSAEGNEFITQKEARFRQLTPQLTPMLGLKRILNWIKKTGLKQAVVTNAPRENALCLLNVLGLADVFPLTILAEDAPPGKLDPAPYRLALERLEVESQQAIAFEDSPSDIRSAVAAGIYTIGVTSTHSTQTLLDAGAGMTIEDFNNNNLWQLIL